MYTIGANGVLNAVTGSPFAAGAQPFSIVLDSSGKYVYVANGIDATISGYLIGTGGGLTALSGSPYASGAQVEALGRDSSGKYLLAAAFGGSPDLTMYSFDVDLSRQAEYGDLGDYGERSGECDSDCVDALICT